MNNRGQAIVEYIIILPVFIIIFASILQFSLILIENLIVKYASFCAARTAIVSDDTEEIEKSAMMVLSAIERSYSLKHDLNLNIRKIKSEKGLNDYVIVHVNYRFPLIVPVANKLFLFLSNLIGIETDYIRKRITISKSYTMSFTEVTQK